MVFAQGHKKSYGIEKSNGVEKKGHLLIFPCDF